MTTPDRRETTSAEEMLAVTRVAVVPRLAFTPEEAGEAIGVSRRFFYEHVLPQLRVTRVGRKRIISRRELDRWLEESAERALEP